MLKRILIILIILCFVNILFSQNNKNKISGLQILFEKMNFSCNDKSIDSINALILKNIENKFNKADFSEFKDIKNLSFLISDDKKVDIITWPVYYSDFTYKYYGFVRYYEPDFERYTVEMLSDKSESIVNPERQILSTDNWYGVLYYKIIYKKYKKNKIYILLGWDGINDLTTGKIVDVFYLDENNEPAFGKEIFNSEDGIKKRLIFEYKEGISMNLRYDKKKDMIIWDHLSPSKPELKGYFEYYGPDLTFDGLYFEKGIWKYIPDVDLRK